MASEKQWRRVGERRQEDGTHDYVVFEGPVTSGTMRVFVTRSTDTLLRVKIHHNDWYSYISIPITLKPED